MSAVCILTPVVVAAWPAFSAAIAAAATSLGYTMAAEVLDASAPAHTSTRTGGRVELELTISPDGHVQLHLRGYTGQSCLEALRWFEQVVGPVESQRETSEFYEPAEEVRFRIGAGLFGPRSL